LMVWCCSIVARLKHHLKDMGYSTISKISPTCSWHSLKFPALFIWLFIWMSGLLSILCVLVAAVCSEKLYSLKHILICSRNHPILGPKCVRVLWERQRVEWGSLVIQRVWIEGLSCLEANTWWNAVSTSRYECFLVMPSSTFLYVREKAVDMIWFGGSLLMAFRSINSQ
jgi:hypothetical protein